MGLRDLKFRGMTQPTLFDNPIPSLKRRIENNKESQEILDNNIDHFSEQCKTVYKALKRGERITTRSALIDYGIGDLRRRIKDLKDFHGVPVKDELTDGRFKVWYL